MGGLDNLAQEAIDQLPDSALGDDLVGIRRQMDRLEAQFLRRLHRFDRNHGAAAEGAVSTVSWLRGRCGITARSAVHRVRMARVLAELPEAMESLSAGRASLTNVSMIARLADAVGTESTRTLESALVTAAEQLDPARMRYLTLVTRHRLDAEGALDEDNRNHERRWFACDQTFDGVFILRGELDAEGGAIVKTALNALSAPSGPDDTRMGSQRCADALVDIASRQLQNGSLPDVHGQRPHLTVTASVETLQRQPSAAPADLRGVSPIHAETARRVACDSVRTLVTVADATTAPVGGIAPSSCATESEGTALSNGMASNDTTLLTGAVHSIGTPLSVGRATRTIPAPIRTALSLRDGGCRFPGCDRPPGWTDGHHIKHWADGGPTSLDNLVLLCRRHHRMVHERRWDIRLDEHGAVDMTEPRCRAPSIRRE